METIKLNKDATVDDVDYYNDSKGTNPDAAIKGKVDTLQGLKENVIIGKLIPAGTGAKEYANIDIALEKQFLVNDAAEALEDNLMDDNAKDAVEAPTEVEEA